MRTDTAPTGGEVIPLGDPVMIAKFLVPAPNGPMLRRRRLVERLSAAVAGRPVTLVCAPAGSGKTVLASSWVTSGMVPGPVVWISLDEDDERPGIFWTYVVTGLERGGVDVEGVGVPRSATSVDRSTLVRLAARLSERAEPAVLVLDNADALSGQLADDVDFLLRHTGERLRLVVLSRVDPALPLPLYRLERLVAEIRFRDLAFTLGEARELLRARSRNLSENDVHTVSDRTRGWAAGLRLTELPDGRGDAGGHEPVVPADDDLAAYFCSEVLGSSRRTSATSCWRPAWCDVVPTELARHLSGSKNAGMTLRKLAQQAAFVEPAPGADEVYRHHPSSGTCSSPDRVRRTRAGGGGCSARRRAGSSRPGGRWSGAAVRRGREGDASPGCWCARTGLARLLAGARSAPLAVACERVPAGLPGAGARRRGSRGRAAPWGARSVRQAPDPRRGAAPAQPADRRSDLDAAVALTSLARTATSGRRAAPGGGRRGGGDRPVRAVRPVDAVVGALLAHGRGCVELADGHSVRARQTLAAAARAAQEAGSPELASACLARLALAEALLGRLDDAGDTAGPAHPHASAGGRRSPRLGGQRTRGPAGGEHARPAGDGQDPRLLAQPPPRRSSRWCALDCSARAATSPARGPRYRPHPIAGPVPRGPRRPRRGVRRRVLSSPRAGHRPPPTASSGTVRPRTTLGMPLLALGGRAAESRAADSGGPRPPRHPPPSAPLDLRVEGELLAAARALALGRPEPAAGCPRRSCAPGIAERLRRPFDEGAAACARRAAAAR